MIVCIIHIFNHIISIITMINTIITIIVIWSCVWWLILLLLLFSFYDPSILDVDFSRKSMLYKGSCNDPYLFIQKADDLKSWDESFKSTCYSGQDSRPVVYSFCYEKTFVSPKIYENSCYNYEGSCSDPYLFVQKIDNLKSWDDGFKSTCYNGQDSRCENTFELSRQCGCTGAGK